MLTQATIFVSTSIRARMPDLSGGTVERITRISCVWFINYSRSAIAVEKTAENNRNCGNASHSRGLIFYFRLISLIIHPILSTS
jgi:hypothetical protein